MQWLLDAGTGFGPMTRCAGWAGASHWRFRAEPDAATADKPKPARWDAAASGSHRRSSWAPWPSHHFLIRGPSMWCL